MIRDDILSRARSTLDLKHPVFYRLGAGGFKPKAKVPWDDKWTLDCSGFVAWTLGVSRWLKGTPYGKNYEWFETTNVERDAHSAYGFVEAIDWTTAKPGDIVVVGDRNHKQGHIAILSATPPLVIHCSKGNERHFGTAIAETPLWDPRELLTVARIQWVE